MKTLLKIGLVGLAGWATAAGTVQALTPIMDPTPTFTAMDTNTDGVVSFEEFATYAETQRIGRTLAAQNFTRLSQGDALLTLDEFILHDMLTPQTLYQSAQNDTAVAGDILYSDTLNEAEQLVPLEEGEPDLIDPVDIKPEL